VVRLLYDLLTQNLKLQKENDVQDAETLYVHYKDEDQDAFLGAEIPTDGFVLLHHADPPGSHTMHWYSTRELALGDVEDPHANAALLTDNTYDAVTDGTGSLDWAIYPMPELPDPYKHWLVRASEVQP
jgi:hypothetical protein